MIKANTGDQTEPMAITKRQDEYRKGTTKEEADFFRRAQETSRKGAEQGKDLLRSRLAS